MKKKIGPRPILFPMPAVLVGTYGEDGTPDAMTAAWAGICCAEPPCAGVAVRRERLTHRNIRRKRAFTLNVPPVSLAAKVDYLGLVSGEREPGKLAKAGIDTAKASKVDAPLLLACPVSLECRLLQAVDLGSHTFFIGEVMETAVDEKIVRPDGKLDLAALDPLVFCPLNRVYHRLGEEIGLAFSIGKALLDGAAPAKGAPRGKAGKKKK
jgi:flavin reductase (DIM6/NTAB) family NADH-FMN oxidoreductase RutF